MVSICIPAYNQPKFLKKTLNSIFIQDFKDYEIIISDDSNNDDIKKLINTYPQEKIKYFKNSPSFGSPRNWNESIKKATGKYIKILHHDDWFSKPYSLSKFVNTIESRNNVSIVFSGSLIHNANLDNDTRFVQSEKKIKDIIKDKNILLTSNLLGAPSATLFKQTTLRFDEKLKWLVDIDFYIQIINKNNFLYISEPLIATTDGANHQVTNKCKNMEIELKEWFYMFNKHRPGRFNVREIVYLFKIMYKYKVSSIQEVEKIYTNIPNKTIVSYIILIGKVLRKIYEKNS